MSKLAIYSLFSENFKLKKNAKAFDELKSKELNLQAVLENLISPRLYCVVRREISA